VQWAGLVLGLAGLALVVHQKFGLGEVTEFNLAMSLMALASITIGTLYQKRYVQPGDARAANGVQIAAALVVSLPFALFEPEPMVWNADVVAALAWSVFGLTLGGSSLLLLLIQRGAATQVTSLLYLVPPCTAVLAWALFREPLSTTTAIGMAMCAAAVALVMRGGTRGGRS
jgi:drug/metabolite transporter (DMT)-like permease